ncbi:MAG: glycosyltransferase, partial [Sinomicrobium sp.]|nr:glycosyltransferase [Sinomicrobium sp.]
MTICLISAYAFLIGLSYFLVIRFVLLHWEKFPLWSIPPEFCPSTHISILIPARNEAANIQTCLARVFSCQYSAELLELIVIDDHSTDETAALVGQLAAIYPGLRLLPLPKDRAGKKAALAFGIEQAQGELIITTDADCQVPPQWLLYIVSLYQEQKPAFIAGPVQLSAAPSLLERFQALDMAGTMLITGAGIRSGTIHMSNGANLAYPKSVFQS